MELEQFNYIQNINGNMSRIIFSCDSFFNVHFLVSGVYNEELEQFSRIQNINSNISRIIFSCRSFFKIHFIYNSYKVSWLYM